MPSSKLASVSTPLMGMTPDLAGLPGGPLQTPRRSNPTHCRSQARHLGAAHRRWTSCRSCCRNMLAAAPRATCERVQPRYRCRLQSESSGYTRLEGRLRKNEGGECEVWGAKYVSKLSCLAEGYLRATPSLARGTPWAVTSQGRFPPAVLTGPKGRPAQVRSSRTSFDLLHVRLQRTSHVSPAARRPCRPHSWGHPNNVRRLTALW